MATMRQVLAALAVLMATVAPAAAQTTTVAADVLRLRGAPRADAPVLANLRHGCTVRLSGAVSADGWVSAQPLDRAGRPVGPAGHVFAAHLAAFADRNAAPDPVRALEIAFAKAPSPANARALADAVEAREEAVRAVRLRDYAEGRDPGTLYVCFSGQPVFVQGSPYRGALFDTYWPGDREAQRRAVLEDMIRFWQASAWYTPAQTPLWDQQASGDWTLAARVTEERLLEGNVDQTWERRHLVIDATRACAEGAVAGATQPLGTQPLAPKLDRGELEAALARLPVGDERRWADLVRCDARLTELAPTPFLIVEMWTTRGRPDLAPCAPENRVRLLAVETAGGRERPVLIARAEDEGLDPSRRIVVHASAPVAFTVTADKAVVLAVEEIDEGEYKGGAKALVLTHSLLTGETRLQTITTRIDGAEGGAGCTYPVCQTPDEDGASR